MLAIYFTNTAQALYNNKKRADRLHDDVLREYAETMTVPTKDEGFNYIQNMTGWFCDITKSNIGVEI